MIFNYSAMDATGREVSGTLDAENQSLAIDVIRKKGLFPIRIAQSVVIKRPTVSENSPKISEGNYDKGDSKSFLEIIKGWFK